VQAKPAEVIDPALSFPFFPDPYGADGEETIWRDGQNAVMPLWYWLKVVEYVIEVERCREVYEAWREIYLAEVK